MHVVRLVGYASGFSSANAVMSLSNPVVDPLSAVRAGVSNDFASPSISPLVPLDGSGDGLIAVALIYGVAYGTSISLVSVPVMAMGPVGDIGRHMSLFMSFAALGALVGTPIFGAINSATGGFKNVGWYAGRMVMFTACLPLLTRYLLGKWMGKYERHYGVATAMVIPLV